MNDAIPAAEPGVCGNCGAALAGAFCPVCGQEDREFRRPFWRILGQFARALVDLDSRVYRSLFLLYTRPGFLSSEYVQGRRARYTPPLRMFLVLSIVFFLLVSIFPQGGDNPAPAQPAAGEQQSERPLRDLPADGEDVDGFAELDLDPAEIRASIEAVPIPFLPEATAGRLKELAITQIVGNYDDMRDDPREFFQEFFSDSLEYVTIFILLMMPLLALLQAVFYVFRRRYYAEHFMLTLHNHSFLIVCAFLLSVTGLMADRSAALEVVADWLDLAIILWAIAYLYLSLKNFYGGGWFYSGLVFFTASLIYSVLTAAGLAIFLIIFFLLY